MQALFARLDAELERAGRELAQAEELAERNIAKGDEGAIVRTAYLAHAVTDVYEALEGILKDIAREIDDFVPGGEDWHRKLLTQMASPVPGVRDAVLSPSLASLLNELRAFRHVVNHRYGTDLRWPLVAENLARAGRAIPEFAGELGRFKAAMHSEGN